MNKCVMSRSGHPQSKRKQKKLLLWYKILKLTSQKNSWFWQPIQEWHVEPFASNLETQLRDFDARPCASTTNSQQ
jgi:hypothetical protein